MNVRSFDLLVVFDNLEKSLQLPLLVLIELPLDQRLGVDAVAHLLIELLHRCPQPVLVVCCRLDALLPQPTLDLAPNLPHFEVRVQLNDFHLLLLHRVELVFAEPHSVQDTEYSYPEIALAHYLFYPVHQVGFCACRRKVF